MNNNNIHESIFTSRALFASPMTQRLILVAGISVAALSLGLKTAAAQTIGFETSEGYTAAQAAFTAGTPVNNATTSIAFGLPNGNANGWTASSSTGYGTNIATVTSGSYVGGQALGTGTASSGNTFIGALNLGLSGVSSFTFDVFVPATLASAQATVGGWYDANSSGTFNQTAETGVVGGLVSSGQFGVRAANFGTTYSSGVAPAINTWYQVTLGYNFAANSATLDVFNLTAGSVVDLNGAAAGNTFTETIASLYGGTPVNPSAYAGVVVRVTANGVLDNITPVTTAVPEPSSTVLLAGGVCLLVGCRRIIVGKS